MAGRTFARQFNSMRNTFTYDDTLTLGSVLESGATTAADDANGLRSVLKNAFDPLGTIPWYTGVPTVNGKQRGFLQLNTNLDSIEEKIGPCYTTHQTTLTVPGGQNYQILLLSATETPTSAVTLLKTAEGISAALGALSAGGFAAHEVVTVAGPDALHPVNLVELIELSSGTHPQSAEGRDIYGYLQTESTFADGSVANDTSAGNRLKISYVKFNATYSAFEPATIADIATKVIRYTYVDLKKFINSDIDCFLGRRAFVDHAGQADITLDRAVDNQGATPATQTTNINMRMTDGVKWSFQDPSGAVDIFSAIASAVQDSVQINGDLDVNNVNSADFAQGIIADSSDQAINIGTTLGQIDSGAALTVKTTVGDLILDSALNLKMDDSYRAASTFSVAMSLSDSTSEWSNYETLMAGLSGGSGEVSLIQGMNLLGSAAASGQAAIPVQAEITVNVDAGDNITTIGGGANIDTLFPDYSNGVPSTNFLSYFWIYYNGYMSTRGINQAALTDFYPGTDPATGDIKSNFKLKTGDQVIATYWGP